MSPRMTDSLLGRRVRIVGGFEDGLTGVVVANEPQAERLYRYRVWLDGRGGESLPQTIGGLHPVNLHAERCPYCGTGGCLGTARSADGSDLERFERVHQPGRDAVAAWVAAGSPR